MSTNMRRCARCGNEYLPEMFPQSATVCSECQRQLKEIEEHKKFNKEAGRTAVVGALIMTVLFGIPGIIAIAAPYALWFISEGWQYKDLEPSDANLIAIRLGGGLMLLIPAVVWVVFVISKRS